MGPCAFLQGDDYVDWVGLSIYHFGTTYPYGQNVLPEAHELTSTVSYKVAAVTVIMTVSQ